MKSLEIGNLSVPTPIIQGGMGVAVSLSGLASAVANQGGIGIISAVAIGLNYKTTGKFTKQANLDGFRNEIQKARKLSPDGILGANIMLAITDFDDLFKVGIEEKLDVIIVGAGLLIKKPETLTLDEFLYSKTKIIPKISSARAADLIFKTWADKFNKIPEAIVIEGSKAGGHLGFKKNEVLKGTQTLIEIIAETKLILKKYEDKFGHKVSIIAGGGIYTGKDIYNVMKNGADGVKMGTRFVTTHECDADINFKMEFINATKNDITIIDSPVGLPGRVIENDFIRKVKNGETKPVKCAWKCLKSCDFKNVPYCIAEALFNAAKGDMQNGFAFSGSNGYKATKIQSVEQVFDELTSEYFDCVMENSKQKTVKVLV